MSNTIPSTLDETSTFVLERCSTCKELVKANQLDPNYDGPLATYANQTYCTLKCMLEPEVIQSTTKES
ncbi:hypothetical protein [Acinetobacter sp. CFCC 10889]|uniref:hypothetical protein n=1 Tax=Acinetobacter sp. CFCC 10889 TaxID=1775557 RepID=UPI000DCFE421|nr:hypothetical protein [Acinetobacter sp. CFCC 10889]